MLSEHLCNDVLLRLPHRQFVFTLPKMLRVYFKYDRELFADISKLVYLIIDEYYNELSDVKVKSGAVISYQSAGDRIRWNSHYHALVLEGGFDEDNNFHFLPINNLNNLTEVFRQRVIKLFVEKNLLNQQMSNNLLSWKHSGFSIDNSVMILKSNDKARLNLCQYIARHPVSLKKITYVKEKEKVFYKTKYNEYFKENMKLFTATDFIAELTQHIPKKGMHLIRYYGLYSSRGRGKAKEDGVIDKFGVGLPDEKKEVTNDEQNEDVPTNKKCNQTWARLIQKVYEVDPMICPKCKSEMKVITIIFDKDEIKKILACLKKNKAPPFD